ncbi:hypothetical protein PSACC_01377 [Paramicrosporidium saccamoebae]|uniref:Uncharacterized protein n=1 Tax=Paramicrosporidium saccamoebae TaxID=1246581 RepID=A0A2H9TM36_9FUNG|nr:hypothetical protein PSACC_01377 [Paramicrosporidium saccamoebae]
MFPTDGDCGIEGHALELRVVALLEEAAQLVERANGVQRTEEKREAVLQGRAMAETVQKLRDDIHRFIKQVPRCDFPRHDTTLLKRYLAVLDQ